ncbi:hypothetical protein ACIQUQ_20335 [Streptomyces sp. NPDC101118]|uniref:hypothetical protein n=1 Tax=Streptomyces sp. NPDC101118 TaxID=3366109 RepID=UPI00381B107E
MTRPFRPHRFVLFAASTAIAAGGVLVPATAFAATPSTSHTVVTDAGDDNKSTLFLRTNEKQIVIDPGDGSGTHHDGGKKHDGKKHPGKKGKRPHKPDRIHVPENPEWQCITAPCGPPPGPDSAVPPGGLAQPGTVEGTNAQ